MQDSESINNHEPQLQKLSTKTNQNRQILTILQIGVLSITLTRINASFAWSTSTAFHAPEIS